MSRIAFLVDHRVFSVDGRFACENPYAKFLLGFLGDFDEAVMINRVFDDGPDVHAPYDLSLEGVRVAPLPPYPSIEALFSRPHKYWPAIEKVLRTEIPRCDAVWLNFGHPVSLRALTLARRHPHVQCFAVLRGNYDVDAGLRTAGGRLRKRIAATVMGTTMDIFGALASRQRVPCVGVGRAAGARLERYGVPVLETCDALIREEDLRSPPDPVDDLAADLLIVGRLTPEKGIDVFLDALPDVRRPDGTGASLRIVGAGPQEEALRAQVERLGLGERVSFDGHVAFGHDLLTRYTSARIVVIPSRTEGIPKVATEALALGRPVVATTVGGLPEVVGDDRSRGLLVAPEDPKAIAGAINELLADPSRLETMGRSARAFASEITIERQVRTILDHTLPRHGGAAER